MKKHWIWALVLACTLGIAAQAADMEAVKNRMIARRAAVRSLVATQKAGENRSGYMEARGTLSAADKKVMEEENGDRKAVYAEIAAKTGASAAQVGAQRAKDLMAKLPAGSWQQDAGGNWVQKK